MSKQLRFPKLDWANKTVSHFTLEMAAACLGVSKSRVKALIAEDRFRSFDKDRCPVKTVFMLDARTVVIAREAVEGLQKLPGGRPKLSIDQKKDLALWLSYGGIYHWMTKAHPSQVPGNCRVCGRRVGTEIPKDGDGSVRVAIKHKPPEPAIKMRLPGGAVVLPRCRGTGLPPKGWRTGKTDYVTGLDVQPEDPRYKGEVPDLQWRPGVKK